MRTIGSAFLTGLLLLGLLPLAGGQVALAEQDNQGFIYGTVTTESGREYKGFLRWDDEEAFWDDLFHSSKDDLPYMDEVDDSHRHREKRGQRRIIKIFNWEIKVDEDDKHGFSDRIFISRFGNIAEIQVTGNNDARLVMRDGERYDVSGYANDVGGKILVRDAGVGDVYLHWERIDTVRFEAPPRGEDPGVFRLHGKLATRYGDFEGFIQWDKEECISTDELDGESEDGDISIPMGRIRSIERYGSRGSEVILKDDRRFRLRGSNDVNEENRGIMVEDPRYGRVVVYWDEFDKLVFSDSEGSGRGYGDYEDSGKLEGKVTDTKGETWSGRIVFDLDETESWEILNGSYRDLEYNIPFRMIRSIEPRRHGESIVVLKSGEELRLEDSQDVSDRNDGVLVFASGNREPEYIPWRKVDRIEFD